eukprot:3459942-Alexandrium_andersonii.AAC.1
MPEQRGPRQESLGHKKARDCHSPLPAALWRALNKRPTNVILLPDVGQRVGPRLFPAAGQAAAPFLQERAARCA